MAIYNEYNPIRTVDGVPVPCPSTYRWKLEDVSAEGSGRTEDVTMHKNRIGQVVGIELAWQNINLAQVSEILKAFNPEYIQVCYFDAMEAGFVTAEFYVGNRSADLYSYGMGLWSGLSFNLIKRHGGSDVSDNEPSP